MRRESLALVAVAALVLSIVPSEAPGSVAGTWRRVQAPTLELIPITDTSIAMTVEGFPIVFTGSVAGDFTLSSGCATYQGRVLAGENVIDGALVEQCGFSSVSRTTLERCTCNDGNAVGGDGCDATCQVEPCWSCVGEPSICTPLAEGAACDDRRDCTAGTTCSAGVCGDGAAVPACVDMTGLWSVVEDDFLAGDTVTYRVAQRDGRLRFEYDIATPVVGWLGTIDPASGAFEVQREFAYQFCLGDPAHLSGVATAGSYSATGELTSFHPLVDCFTHAITSVGTRACANTPDGTPCDDGDPCTSGDACSASTCVGAVVPDGTACDDGNACTTSDSCAAGACGGAPLVCGTCQTCNPAYGCAVAPNGSGCDDGTACTAEDRCTNATCGGETVRCDTCESCDATLGCVERPRTGCEQALGSKSSLLARVMPNGSASLTWKWKGGDGVTLADLGTPIPPSGGADFCIYDESGPTPSLLFRGRARGGFCNGPTCWQALGGKGYKYRNLAADDGLVTMTMKSGTAGRASATVAGKGPNLTSRADGLTAPPFGLPLRAQLQADAICFDAAFTASGVSKNAGGLFKAKSQ